MHIPNLGSSLARLLAVVLAALGSLRIGVGLWAWRAANRLERPSYTVLRRLPGTGGGDGIAIIE